MTLELFLEMGDQEKRASAHRTRVSLCTRTSLMLCGKEQRAIRSANKSLY
jgi:hypothetical protein